MHACIIETAITEREYLSVVHSEPCGIKNRSPTTECFYIGKLHTSGLRNIIYKKNVTIQNPLRKIVLSALSFCSCGYFAI